MILVTGGLGMIGAHTARALIDLGHEVVVTSHRRADVPSFLVGKVTVESLDVTDRDAFLALAGRHDISDIVHLAGSIPDEDPVSYFRTDTTGLLNALDAARTWGVRRFAGVAAPVLPATGSTRPTEPAQPLPLPDKPSIAVLPFTNMSGDPEDYFSDGIVEEIISALSRFQSLFVIARNSTFTYKRKPVDVRQVSSELGVRYVLEGSVRKLEKQLRIIANLIDGPTGRQIWSKRYDDEIDNIFDLQDRVTEAIVGAVEPTITLSEIERAKRKRPESLDSYECAIRALPAVWSENLQVVADGLRLAERAMQLDPGYPLPKALAAWCYGQCVVHMQSLIPDEDQPTR